MNLLWLTIYGLAVFSTVIALLYLRQRQKTKRAAILLKEAKQEVSDIAQLPLSNPNPVIQISESSDILFINSAAQDLIKNTSGSVISLLQDLSEHLDSRNVVTREIVIGANTFMQVITPSQAGKQTAYIIYFMDISSIKENERALIAAKLDAEKLRQEAEHANNARGEFLANMSHELRTPMNGIIGLSDMLAEADLPEEHQEMAKVVNSSARSLLILLNDILDFSKIEAGELSIETIPFSLHEVISRMEVLHKSVALSKGLMFSTNVSADVPVYVESDPARLQQILNNLISNALKFTEEGRVNIEVNGSEQDNNNYLLEITVQDTGIGIPQEKQQQIFEKFQQAENSTSRKYGGTGLGLAITKDLLEMMGGSIAIKSQVGQGTSFYIKLLVKMAEMPTEQNNARPAKDILFQNASRIMIVDDHPVNLLYMRKTLNKLGIQNFAEAKNGREALDLFQKDRFDLILMDCQMPDMDGFEASREIRRLEDNRNKPVIIAVTADAMKGAEEKCKAAGMDGYISKPVERERLSQILKTWLPHKEVQEEKPQETGQPQIQDVDLQTFNWSKFYEFTHGDSELEATLMTMFTKNLHEDLKSLHESFQKEDYEAWDKAAHKIYGASSNIGAEKLADVCDQVHSLSSFDKENVRILHKEIISQSHELHHELQQKKAAA